MPPALAASFDSFDAPWTTSSGAAPNGTDLHTVPLTSVYATNDDDTIIVFAAVDKAGAAASPPSGMVARWDDGSSTVWNPLIGADAAIDMGNNRFMYWLAVKVPTGFTNLDFTLYFVGSANPSSVSIAGMVFTPGFNGTDGRSVIRLTTPGTQHNLTGPTDGTVDGLWVHAHGLVNEPSASPKSHTPGGTWELNPELASPPLLTNTLDLTGTYNAIGDSAADEEWIWDAGFPDRAAGIFVQLVTEGTTGTTDQGFIAGSAAW